MIESRRAHRSETRRRIAVGVFTFVIALSGQSAWTPGPVHAQATNAITLHVQSARTEPKALGGAGVEKGDPITEFKYIINLDNTGTTNQRTPADGCSPAGSGYPDSCAWASIAGLASHSPVVTQGDQSDFGNAGLDLPDGRYLVSVLADGFKLDGVHFSVPMTAGAGGLGHVTVELQPTPLPTATVKAQVFVDSSTNGQYDPGEDGLPGFRAILADTLGPVTTDVYGNPICTEYETDSSGNIILSAAPDYAPTPIPGTGGNCYSDADGVLTIPNMGTNRYTLSLDPPAGSKWVQTTTLEGNHDWDAWVMEGATGLDTEFVVAGEPVPAIIFGYAPAPSNSTFWNANPHLGLPSGDGTSAGACASSCITGIIDAVKVYVPPNGGLVGEPGFQGGKLAGPISKPWVALTDLNAGDAVVWVGRGNANGKFTIPNVPDGTYILTYWDEPQDYILEEVQVTISGGEAIDLGTIEIAGWWAQYSGYVFNDLNRNGRRDAGEPGVPNYGLTLRRRDNSLMDRGTTAVSTDASGYYWFESAYPLTEWLVMEAYNDLYYTTGITYQADNQDSPTTILGAGVDVSVLPIIGLSGTMDWGVHTYDPTGSNGIDPQNGGIVGTVTYDTTRNELDPRYAAAEDWQPSVSNLTVELYQPVDCGTHSGVPCDARGDYELAPDGSYAHGPLLNTYLTETWEAPTGCIARDVNNDPLLNPGVQQVLPFANNPTTQDPTKRCLEGPLMGTQFGPYPTDQGTPDANFGAAVDGNYGFGDACLVPDPLDPDALIAGNVDATDPAAPVCMDGDGNEIAFTPLDAGDYLVRVVVPTDDVNGRPLYNFTREEDINIGNGDQFIPQVPPPACAGALHTVDVAGAGTDGYGAVAGTGTNGIPVGVTVPASTPTDNPTFLDIGGSPFEGKARPLCDTKLVPLQNGKSIAPTFYVFTDVPIPGRFFGLLVDDLNFSTDPKSLLVGEKAGVPFAPVGIYDFDNRLVTTVETDYNGIYDVLLPSTNRISCPTPSGVCANVYRFVGNDPGVPGRLNLNYNPQYRTIAAEFEAMPGLNIPADNAPTQVGVSVQLPGGQVNQAVACPANVPSGPLTPELFKVSKPYADMRDGVAKSFTITGQGFGAGPGQVLLDATRLGTTSWSDRTIVATIPGSIPGGPHQLTIVGSNGQRTINGLTFHTFGFGPFPSTAVLDNFNRNGIGNTWSADSVYALNSNSIQVTGTGTMRFSGSNSIPSNFGANQEAYFTFLEVSPTATEQGLFLKITGSGNNPNPTDASASYLEVAYDATTSSVRVWTKNAGQSLSGGATANATLRATFPGVTFGANDTLGARALSTGQVIAYRNGTEIGRVTIPSSGTGSWAGGSGGGRLGVRFVAAQNNATNDARFDDFGGGTIAPYAPNVYEVGPGRTYDPGTFNEANPSHAIQNAINDAAASPGDDLVVVYPGTPTPNPRVNPRGAYFENLVMAAPVKLQGVGPGGIYPDGTPVIGSIVDGSAFGGDTVLADDWRTLVEGTTWVGNQNAYEGQVMYLLARSENQYGSAFKAAIDGFDIRGGNQFGFPNNINQTGGGPSGQPPNVVTQGGAIFANAYVRNLQITNNVVQNNGGSYGTIRIGTPDLPAPDTSQHNEDLRIANNRIIANAGTNLAGGIGIFAGADRYEVAANDICGNFSAEYGGGVSVYGLSPNGRIHDNRIYLNRSYDEGGGIMIAGQLPFDAGLLSPGSGAVDIYANLIQSNLANDDGGGIRFLMVGNFPMNVYDNIITNNVSTHEGGGVALDDAPNVRFHSNTVMKNITTSTAVTSNGQPAPAGLSTGRNSIQLQASLPSGSPTFSRPILFNDIFCDNRSGTRAYNGVTGIGAAGDATAINYWDMGTADGSGLLAPTYSVLGSSTGTVPGTMPPSTSNHNVACPANLSTLVADPFDLAVSFAVWRTNPNFIDAILVALDVPPTVAGDYHLANQSSVAFDGGAASKTVGTVTVSSPTFDIDHDLRPAFAGFDIGADEIPVQADLSISKTDNQTTASPGSVLSYTIVVTNNGPDPVVGATIADTFPSSLTVNSWTCTASSGSSCSATGSGNARTGSASLLNGGTATYTAGTTLATSATVSVSNTATVAAPAGVTDPNPGNNIATDTDTIPTADLSITKTDGQTTALTGSTVTYTIVASNAGPNGVVGATVMDTFPASLSGVTWTCTASSGSSCPASGTGNLSASVSLASGGSATFTASGTLASNASGALSNTATVATPSGTGDPNLANNSATDTDTIVPARPTGGLLDNFNRANTTTVGLGANWAQTGTSLRVNGQQALAFSGGGSNNNNNTGLWNTTSPSPVFAADQWAAFTFANTTTNNSALLLKASGGTSAAAPTTYIRVRYRTSNGSCGTSGSNRICVETTSTATSTGGGTYTVVGVLQPTGLTFASGDTLVAAARSDGSVDVWKTTAANVTTYLGRVTGTGFTGTGRIGIQLPTSGTRIDNFSGGNLP